jgi:hypothetical protein
VALALLQRARAAMALHFHSAMLTTPHRFSSSSLSPPLLLSQPHCHASPLTHCFSHFRSRNLTSRTANCARNCIRSELNDLVVSRRRVSVLSNFSSKVSEPGCAGAESRLTSGTSGGIGVVRGRTEVCLLLVVCVVGVVMSFSD